MKMQTFTLTGERNSTVLLRHRVVTVYHDGATLGVIQEHGHRMTMQCEDIEAAKAYVERLTAWLQGE